MAALTIAISSKALKILEGTEIGKLIAAGVKQPDGSISIPIEAETETKIAAAKESKTAALGDRLIACLSKPQPTPEAEGLKE